jgi:hypothetical protein
MSLRDWLFRSCFRSTLEGLRVWLNGPHPPNFSTIQNPAAHAPDILTRTLTFHYYASFHAYLMVVPVSLCCDWTAGSIPLLESLADPRVAGIVIFYLALCLAFEVVILTQIRQCFLLSSGGYGVRVVTTPLDLQSCFVCESIFSCSDRSLHRFHCLSCLLPPSRPAYDTQR